MKKTNTILSVFIIILIFCIIISPAKYISACLNGISIWATKVLPSILPFMILTKMLADLKVINHLANKVTVFKKIYHAPSISSYTFMISIISGYPVGSKIIADLYESNQISQNDAIKMCSFCSNSGPMFILGSIGIGMLQSISAGYIILFSHILSALINGLIYRNINFNGQQKVSITAIENEFNFGDIIISSTQAVLSICAIISLFFIIIEAISPLTILFPEPINACIQGLIEMTKGCLAVSNIKNIKLCTVLCSFLISFGGFSTIFQSIALLKKANIPIGIFTLQKFTQAIISTLISLILVLLIF